MAQELSILKKALHDERAERIRIQATEMEKVLKSLSPIHVPQPKDNRINELEQGLMKLKHVRIKKTVIFNCNIIMLKIFINKKNMNYLYRTIFYRWQMALKYHKRTQPTQTSQSYCMIIRINSVNFEKKLR